MRLGHLMSDWALKTMICVSCQITAMDITRNEVIHYQTVTRLQWWCAMLCNHTLLNNNYIQIAGMRLQLLCIDKLGTFISLVHEMHQTYIDICDCPFRYLVVWDIQSISSRYEIFVFHIDAHIRFITNNYSTQHEEVALKKTVWLDVPNSEKYFTCTPREGAMKRNSVSFRIARGCVAYHWAPLSPTSMCNSKESKNAACATL